MITWTPQSAFLWFDTTCWTVAAAVKITLEADTSPARIGLLNDQLPPRTAFWEVEMWVRLEVLRRDQIDHPPLPLPHCFMWPLARNLNPQNCRERRLGSTLTVVLFIAYFLTSQIFWYGWCRGKSMWSCCLSCCVWPLALSPILKSLFWCQGHHLHCYQTV